MPLPFVDIPPHSAVRVPVGPTGTPLTASPPLVLTPEKISALSLIEKSKRLAAFAAVDKHLLKEHKVIGIGSGTCAGSLY
jgi:ribose 5-phosphate isomerase A